MKRPVRILLLGWLALAIVLIDGIAIAAEPGTKKIAYPIVRMTTNKGVVEVELYRDKAPITVDNFLKYVKNGHYNGIIFHRVIKGFMIQSGGFGPGMKQRPTGAPIKNEADKGLKNLAGTIAMARTSDPHSASAQFFINTVDNHSLDHTGKTPAGWGYAVFGRVVKGMDVVKRIEDMPTGAAGRYRDVPRQDVIIRNVELVATKGKTKSR